MQGNPKKVTIKVQQKRLINLVTDMFGFEVGLYDWDAVCLDWRLSTVLYHSMQPTDIMTSSNGNIFRVTGPFPSQRPMTRSFDVFFDLRLNKRLSKQSWGWWFETPSGSIWRHCNELFFITVCNQQKLLKVNKEVTSPTYSITNISATLHIVPDEGHKTSCIKCSQRQSIPSIIYNAI